MFSLKGPLPYSVVSDSPNEFQRWKRSRHEIISEIDKQILNRSDGDLTILVDSWLNIAKENTDYTKPQEILYGLMHLSVYYHYHRDITSIQELIPIVQNFFTHPNRCVARVSSNVVWFFAEESSENVDLFHTIVSEVPNWIDRPVKDKLVYSALCVLYNAYGHADKMVNDIVMKCFKSIFNIAFCDDEELQQLAVFVLKLHFMWRKPDTIEKYYKDCANYVLTKKNCCIKGAMSLLKYWLPLKFDVDPELILSALNKIHISPEIAEPIAQTLDEMSKFDYIDFSKPSFNKLFLTLLAFESPTLIDIAKRIPTKYFPFSDTIAKMKDKIKRRIPFAYEMTTIVLSRNKSFKLPFSIPLNTDYPKEFIKLLECGVLVYEYRQQMAQFCTAEFANPTQEKTSLAALRIAKTFGKLIFKNIQEQTNKIVVFTRSANPVLRIATVKAIAKLGIPHATKVLLQIALLDVDPSVRYAAVKKLHVDQELMDSPMTIQLLNDTNVDVKLIALNIISEANNKSPMMFYSDLFIFIKRVLENFAGLESFEAISDYSRLFPAIAEICIKSYKSFLLELGKFCILFLSRGKIFAGNHNFFINSNNILPPSERKDGFPLRTEIFGSLYSSYIDARDLNLIKTLKAISPHLKPIVNEIIEVLGELIIGRKDAIIKASVSCMRKALLLLPINDYFSESHKEITNQLFKILSTTSNKALSITILKFFGSSSISHLPNHLGNSDSTFAALDVNSQDFVFRSLMEAIIANLNPPPPSIFDTIKSIFRKEPIAALSYTTKIIPALITTMQTATTDTLSQLFSILGEIAICTGHLLDEFAKDICELINSNMSLLSCVKCATNLSYSLNSAMTPYMPPIFFRAVTLIRNSATAVSKYPQALLKLICFAVLYQNQPLHLFLTSCDNCVHHIPLAVLKELIRIVQNSVSAVNHGSRIARFFTDMYPFWGKEKAIQLLYSLIYYRGVNTAMAIQIKNILKIEDENLNILLSKTPEQRMLDGLPAYIKKKKAAVVLPPLHLQSTHNQNMNIFTVMRFPKAQTTNKWMFELCSLCISRSPINLFHDTQKLVSESIPFRQQILPIAFLTCFQKSPENEKECFLSQLKEVFAINKTVDSAVYRIIDLLEMLGTNHGISNKLLAEKTDSPWRSIFYWRRHIISHPQSADLEPMLDKMYKMGRLATARGILDLAGSKMNPKNCALWRERVTDWDGALKIYATYNSKADLIRCLGNLERWDEVRSTFSMFESLSYEEKQQTAPWYASAFYYANNFQEVDKLLKYFPEEEGLKYGFIKILTFIQENKFKDAKKVIAKKFNRLVENTAIYGGTNQHMAERYLIFAQHLIELTEVIDIKESGKSSPPSIWMKRLSTFMGKGRDWRELSDIRNLLLPGSDHSEIALKMAISLRKDRRWGIIESIHKRMLLISLTPDIIIERLRCKWSQGAKTKALKAICFIRDSYAAKTNEEIDAIFDKIPSVVLEDLISIYSTVSPNSHITPAIIKQRWKHFLKTNVISPKKFASLTRTAAAWQIREEGLTTDDLKTICEQLSAALKADEENQGAWFYHGYAKTLILNMDEEEENDVKQQNALDAIDSFLRCTNLQSLNLLIWTLFNFASKDLLEKEDLFNLQTSYISEAIPQMIEALSSDNEFTREIATKMLLKIGSKNFQSIVYYLKSSPCELASTILSKLLTSESNITLNKDAGFFIDLLCSIATSDIEKSYSILTKMLDAINTGNEEKLKRETGRLMKMNTSGIDNILYLINKRDESAPFAIEALRREYEKNFDKILFYILNVIKEKEKKYNDENEKEKEKNERIKRIILPGHHDLLFEHFNQIPNVTTGTNRPRLVDIIASNGNKFRFQLRGTSVKKDERIMQFTKVLCQMFNHTSHFKYSPPVLNITPLSTNAGLIEIPSSAESMESLIQFFTKEREIEKSVIDEKYGPSLPKTFTGIQMMELNESVAANTKGEELLETIWRNAPAISSWVSASDTITQTYASQAIIGYVIGLEDRRLGNMLISRDNGYVINTNFSSAFSQSLTQPRRAERVPFRMTRAIRYLMDGANPYGLFQRTCENVLTFMSEKRTLLVTQISILSSFAGVSAIEAVKDRLSGIDKNIDDEQRSAQQHVSKLIEVATNKQNSGAQADEWRAYW